MRFFPLLTTMLARSGCVQTVTFNPCWTRPTTTRRPPHQPRRMIMGRQPQLVTKSKFLLPLCSSPSQTRFLCIENLICLNSLQNVWGRCKCRRRRSANCRRRPKWHWINVGRLDWWVRCNASYGPTEWSSKRSNASKRSSTINSLKNCYYWKRELCDALLCWSIFSNFPNFIKIATTLLPTNCDLDNTTCYSIPMTQPVFSTSYCYLAYCQAG